MPQAVKVSSTIIWCLLQCFIYNDERWCHGQHNILHTSSPPSRPGRIAQRPSVYCRVWGQEKFFREVFVTLCNTSQFWWGNSSALVTRYKSSTFHFLEHAPVHTSGFWSGDRDMVHIMAKWWYSHHGEVMILSIISRVETCSCDSSRAVIAHQYDHTWVYYLFTGMVFKSWKERNNTQIGRNIDLGCLEWSPIHVCRVE